MKEVRNEELAEERRAGRGTKSWQRNEELAEERRAGRGTKSWQRNEELAEERRAGRGTKSWQGNEELAEESDKKLRSFNVIVHGVNEVNREDKDEAKKMDTLKAPTTFKSVLRIGNSRIGDSRSGHIEAY